MTLQDLKNKVIVSAAGYGHKNIQIVYKGKKYNSTTTNTMATDRVNSDDDRKIKGLYYETVKEAYLSLYNECKRANNLR